MKRVKIECGKCNEHFSKSNIKRHEETCDGSSKKAIKVRKEWLTVDGRYKCPFCDKVYSKMGIGNHIWKNHGDGKNHDPNIGYSDGSRIVWNKGETKESNEALKAHSEVMKRGFADGSYKIYGYYSEEYRQTDAYKDMCKRNGGFRKGAGRGKKEYVTNIEGTRYLLRSSYEVKLAVWLNEKGILWIQPKSFSYVMNGEKKRYYPDFFIPSKDVIVETKNDYLMSKQVDKFKAIRESSPYEIKILLNDDIANLEESAKFLVA